SASTDNEVVASEDKQVESKDSVNSDASSTEQDTDTVQNDSASTDNEEVTSEDKQVESKDSVNSDASSTEQDTDT
ncbi:hypothetical protein, partial [Staphylococcus pseudoxylosus]